MTDFFSRRAILLGAASALADAALTPAAMADAPQTALRPVARPAPSVRPAMADLIAAANLGGIVGCVVADARTGMILEQSNGAAILPPASVAKAVTALYALDLLGPGYRFSTRLIGTGPVVNGVLEGDLVLAGGGDPVLSTDHLATMAERLKQAGIQSVRGAFQVWGGALPYVQSIDSQQQEHLGYNPAVSGLNLNFNRVYFEWARSSATYIVTMDARTDKLRPVVTTARMTVVDRDLPVYTYTDADGVDDWTVARTALGDGGSRWLPVRRPALYAGDVFRSMVRAQGIDLPAATEADSLPAGAELVRLLSDPLDVLIRDMLKYSTNLTAEAIGLTATAARGVHVRNLTQSARSMAQWARRTMGVGAVFVDHSGLGDASDMSASEMVRVLVAAVPAGQLRGMMKDIVLVDSQGEALPEPPAMVVAKTGTLNFVSALAGYIRTPGGADMAFAIFSADPSSRTLARQSQAEVPNGARDWNQRAKGLQQELLQRWAVVYAG